MTDYAKGVFYILLSSFFFALMAVCVRLAGDIYFIQKTFFRNFFSFCIAAIAIIRHAKISGWKSLTIPRKALPFLFLRAAAGTVGIFGNFYAIDHLILSDAAILNKMSPFFAVIASFFLLKETVPLVTILLITGAFGGAMLIVKPAFDFAQMLPTLSGFVSGIGAGTAYASIRKLGNLKCPAEIVILFFSGISSFAAVPYLLTRFQIMNLFQTLMLICSGLAAAAGQFLITAAYYHAPAAKISIFDFSQVIFSAGLGFIIFRHKPDIFSTIGYCIIISMAVLNFLYQSKTKLR